MRSRIVYTAAKAHGHRTHHSGDLRDLPPAIGILPLGAGFLLSLPFGIWALSVLSRRDVQTAFAGESERKQVTKLVSAVGWTLPGGMALGSSLGAAIDPGNIAVYMVVGMVIGLLVGYGNDRYNRRRSTEQDNNTNFSGIGLTLGAAVGVAFGAVVFSDNVALWIGFCMPVGAGIGLGIGAVLSARKKQ